MNISSLSINNKRKLSELLSDLIDILKRIDDIVNTASKEVERMDAIEKMQANVDSKSSEILKISTAIDAKELQELVNKSDKLSKEKDEIIGKSKLLNEDLNELEQIKNGLINEINAILKASNTYNKEKSIHISSLNDNVYIVDSKLPDEKPNLSSQTDEIIKCQVELINEITSLYGQNISVMIVGNNDEEYEDLKLKVKKYTEDKDNSYERQMAMIIKSFENDNGKVVLDTDETKKDEVKEENIRPLSSIISDTENTALDQMVDQSNVIPLANTQINQTEEQSNEVITPNITQETIQEETTSNVIPLPNIVDNPIETIQTDDKLILIIKDKVELNQIARATKDKLYNKIIVIFDGSYPKTEIKKENEVTTNNNISVDNFLNNKAA